MPAPEDRRERLTILLHKRLDQVIDKERQPGISPQERERLAGLHRQIRTDLAAIRYGATEKTVRDLERKYKTRRLFSFANYGSHMGHTCGFLSLNQVKGIALLLNEE